jgi:RNA polymerase sigma factor (sigma-70 family)
MADRYSEKHGVLLTKWTDAEFVDDLMLFKQWERYVWHQINYWNARLKANLSRDDMEDIFSATTTHLLELAQDVRPYKSYMAKTIQATVRKEMIRHICKDGRFSAYLNRGESLPVIITISELTSNMAKRYGGGGNAQPTDEDALEAAMTIEPEDEERTVITKLILEQSLSKLTARQRKVITWRYGINDCGIHTLDEVGKKLGLSREMVRVIEEKAMARLKKLAAFKVRR